MSENKIINNWWFFGILILFEWYNGFLFKNISLMVLGSKKNRLKAKDKYGKIPIWKTIELNKWKKMEIKNA